ncbi:MAG: long-chain fatty acid--CoA ligase [Deltaproteobacteria bacterium]|nr:long-chain fatty acid--CoA ligase [Deltaproteobacteria bacterium]
MNFGRFLARRSLLTGDRTAVVDGALTLTFRELNARANATASALLRTRHRKGDRVAVLCSNCHEFLEIYFATAKLGLVMVPLNYRLSIQELAAILEDCSPRSFVFSSDLRDAASALHSRTAGVETWWELGRGADAPSLEGAILSEPTSEPATEWDVSAEDPHLIMYTSGTTGRAKGAVYTHSLTLWHTFNMLERLTIHPEDRELVFAPLFHCSTINNIAIPTFYMGGALVLQKKFEPQEALALIEKERVSHTVAVPTLFAMMAEQREFERTNLKSLRFFVVGGAPCPVELLQIYLDRGVGVLQGYGLTEAGPVLLLLSSDVALSKVGSAGKPVFHTETRVVAPTGEETNPGEVGEIIARGPSIIREYWHLPEETAKALQGGWLQTGDMARVDEEGYVYIVERKKDMYISGGENVYPVEIERVLNTHPKIAVSAVIGVPDKKWAEVGKAIVELKPGEQMDAADVLSYCQGKLAKYKVPKYVTFVPSLPRNALGKLQKGLLRRDYGTAGMAERLEEELS